MSVIFNAATLDAELTQIHRQEQGTVLDVCTKLRTGHGLGLMQTESVTVQEYAQWMPDIMQNPETFANAGFCIVDKHTTRRKVNRLIRELLLNRTAYKPEPGDRLVVCRNCAQTGLANGDVIEVESLEWRADFNGYLITAYRHLETGETFSSQYDQFAIPVNRLAQTYDQRHTKIFRKGLDKADLPLIPVDFGWAITCHAAQGSERDDVVVIGSWMGGLDLESKSRWTYTALTRARERVLAYIQPLPPLPAWKPRKSPDQQIS